jgi:tetratricopeptide (TPR) repeat protein
MGITSSLLRTRLKLAAALRGQGKLDAADQLVSDLIKENPKYIEPLFEKGMLLEARAEKAKAQERAGKWAAALGHWQKVAKDLERFRPRPILYYDAWYHVALVLSKQTSLEKASDTQGVMRLAPSVQRPSK